VKNKMRIKLWKSKNLRPQEVVDQNSVIPNCADWTEKNTRVEDARLIECCEQIVNSGLFDSDWYMARYPEICQLATNPVFHYLKYGASEGKDPGPEFSTSWYLDAYKDVAESRMNPLVHYLRHGQGEGRKISRSSLSISIPLLIETAYETKRPLSFPSIPIEEVPWSRQKDLNGLSYSSALMFLGTCLGKPDPEGISTDVNSGLSGFTHTLIVFCKLAGMSASKADHATQSEDCKYVLNPVGSTPGKMIRPTLCFDQQWPEFKLVDVWYINSNELRLRISQGSGGKQEFSVIRIYERSNLQLDSIQLVAEYCLSARCVNIVDVRMKNPFMPLLITFSTIKGLLQSVTLLPFPSICRGGLHYGELCATRTGFENLDNHSKLSRDVLANLLMQPAPGSHDFLSRINIDLQGATGSEPVFSPELRKWMEIVFKIRCYAVNHAAVADKKIREYLERRLGSVFNGDAIDRRSEKEKSGLLELTLPCDAIPSLYTLASTQLRIDSGDNMVTGSFIITDDRTMEPKWKVIMPGMGKDFHDLQPVTSFNSFPVLTHVKSTFDSSGWQSRCSHLAHAIRFYNTNPRVSACQLLPVSAGIVSGLIRKRTRFNHEQQPSVSVLLELNDIDSVNLRILLESLLLQDLHDNLEIIVIPGSADELQKSNLESGLQQLFSRKFKVITHTNKNRYTQLELASDLAAGEFILLLNQEIILHDARTLSVLCQLADNDKVASASCLLIQQASAEKSIKVEFYSGGMIIPAAGTDSAISTTLDIYSILNLCTYPVIANYSNFQMIRKDNWLRILKSESDNFRQLNTGLDYSLKAIELGYSHLSTTIVSAGIQGGHASSSLDNYTIPSGLPGNILEKIARSAISIEELHG